MPAKKECVEDLFLRHYEYSNLPDANAAYVGYGGTPAVCVL